MKVYFSDSVYQNSIMALMKAFYPFEVIEKTSYEQARIKYIIEATQVAVAYFNAQNQLVCQEIGQAEGEVYLALEGKDQLKYGRLQLRRLSYDMLVELSGHTLPWGFLMGIRPTKLALQLLQELGDYGLVMNKLCMDYRLSEEKAALLIDVVRREQAFLDNSSEDHSVYIGVPFCPSKCSYCTFPSYRADQWPEAYRDYTKALIREIRSGQDWFKDCTSIYLGGGTPTSLNDADFDSLLAVVRDCLGQRDIEFTVEAGRPDSISLGKLKSMQRYGVNRISINPQTMQSKTLAAIGRDHDSRAVIDCFNTARRLGFEHINMDLILGLPGEDLEDVEDTLKQLMVLQPESITVHTLAYKRGAQLNDEKEKHMLTSADALEKSLNLVQVAMKANGYKPYYLYRQKQMVGQFENVGYCKPGCESIYNIRIMEEVESVVAFGAGAISKRVIGNKIERLEQPKDVNTYLAKVSHLIEKKRTFFEEVF